MGAWVRRAGALGLALVVLPGLCGASSASSRTVAERVAATAPRPWMNAKLDPDARVRLLLQAMTRDEKLRLVFGYFGSPQKDRGYVPSSEARMGSAGYVPGIPRLGVPAQWETDAGLGVATQRDSTEPYRQRTSLPSGLATAATWDPALAERGGAMIGAEARASGFNVMLAGGVDLVRDPRNGRNFEYAGEDPLLAGTMVGAEVRGIETNHVISTVKHYALNDQETGRMALSAELAEDQARMSDLLAFQLALEASHAGSVMCAYNRVGGTYACENPFLLNEVLKRDWGFKGYVMSDWGGTHSTVSAANAGLDQESAYTFDKAPYFGRPLADAVSAGEVSAGRLDDMAGRILRSMFAKGLFEHPVRPGGAIDFAAHAQVAQADAEAGIVLLKNRADLLPLASGARRIAVIGGHADKGVMAGGGSSTVWPVGGNAVPGLGPEGFPGPIVYDPSSPLAAIRALAGRGAEVRFADGLDRDAAARLAAQSDVVVVFATQWTGESLDAELKLDGDQDALVEAVAAANPRTVVVLETGGPVRMPWLNQATAVIEAWYPGSRGGEAIANLLFGRVAPSGRLPVTFPKDESQLPRPKLDGDPAKPDRPFEVNYDVEGAAVGYKWFDKRGLEPLFPFGYGLTYTHFAYSGLEVRRAGPGLSVRFTVRNTGPRAAMDTPQVYVAATDAGWEAPKRLAGWSKLALKPGEARRVEVRIDPRLLAVYDARAHGWRIRGGSYKVLLAASARDLRATAPIVLPQAVLKRP